MQQSIKIHAKSIQNRPKWCQGTLRKRPWEQVGSRLLRKAPNLPTADTFLVAFLQHLGDFGCHFGPSWAPRGSPNRAFGRQGVPKAAKIASKKRSKKKLDLLIEFWSVIGRLGGPRSSFLLQFYNVSVVLAYYEEIKNFIKNPCQNWSQSQPKIDVWAIRGPTFEVLGGFLRSLIFDEFSIGEKSA